MGSSLDKPAKPPEDQKKSDLAPKQPDDAIGIAAEKLGLLYDAAIGRPLQGLSQVSDKVLGTNFHIAEQPPAQLQPRNALDWHANVIIENAGALVPLLVASGIGRLGMLGVRGTATALGATRFASATAAFESSALGAFTTSTSAGAIQAFLFQPTQGAGLGDNWHNAAVGAITMGSLHGFARGLGRYATPESFSPLASRLYQGGVGGIASGIVGTNADSLLRNGSLTTNVLEPAYGGGVSGLAIAGLLHRAIPITAERQPANKVPIEPVDPSLPAEWGQRVAQWRSDAQVDQLKTLQEAQQAPPEVKRALLTRLFEGREFVMAEAAKPLFQSLPVEEQMNWYHQRLQAVARSAQYGHWEFGMLDWLPEEQRFPALSKGQELTYGDERAFLAQGYVPPHETLLRSANELPADQYWQMWSRAIGDTESAPSAIRQMSHVPEAHAVQAWQQAWDKLAWLPDEEGSLRNSLVQSLQTIPAGERYNLLSQHVLATNKPLDATSLINGLTGGDPMLNARLWHEVLELVEPDHKSPLERSGLDLGKSAAVQATPLDELVRFSYGQLRNLPEGDRKPAFERLRELSPSDDPKAITRAVSYLPASERAGAYIELIKNGIIPDRFDTEIPIAERPALIDAFLKAGGGRPRSLQYMYPLGDDGPAAETVASMSKALASAVDHMDPDVNAVAREWLQNLYYRERGDGPSLPGETFAMRSAIAEQLTPQQINRLILPSESWVAADRLAESSPNAMCEAFSRMLMKAGNADGKPVESHALEQLLQSWEQNRSLTQVVQEGVRAALDPAGLEKQARLHDFSVDGFVGGLARDLPPMERRDALLYIRNELLSQSKWQESGRDADLTRTRAAALIGMAREIGQSEPEYFQTRLVGAVHDALSNTANDFSWRLATANGIAAMQRMTPADALKIEIPSLRMPEAGNLNVEQKTALRSDLESRLLSGDPGRLAEMLGAGPLGRMFPSVFGFESEGGMVGKRQHQEHDYLLHDHSLKTVEQAKAHPLFGTLSQRDQVDTLWAALLHDSGKRSEVVDVGHEDVSASYAWGVLSTAGYHPARIQRIAKLISRDHDMSFDPGDKGLAMAWKDPNFVDDLSVYYRSPSAITQLKILNESDIRSVHRDSHWWTPQVERVLDSKARHVEQRRAQLSNNMLPLLTSDIPQGFALRAMPQRFAALAHVSDDLQGTFLKQLATIQSREYSMSTSLITNDHLFTAKPSNLVALVTGDYFDVSQVGAKNLSTGYGASWSNHVQLAKKFADPKRVDPLAQTAADLAAEAGVKDPAGKRSPLEYLRDSLAQFDTIDDLAAAAESGQPHGQFSPEQLQSFVQAQQSILQELTKTELDYGGRREHNEIKLNNPHVSGVGIMRGGKPVFLEASESERPQLVQQLSGGQPVPDWLHIGGQPPPDAVVLKRSFWQDLQRLRLPLVVLDDVK